MGRANPDNFPFVNDYRNPLLAEAMKILGMVNKYNRGIAKANKELQKAEVKREIIGAYVLYPGRREPHLCKEYDESIRRENIGAIPFIPGFLDQIERRLSDILDKKTSQSHLAADIPTRGTSVVVGEAFSEAEIPTIVLHGNEWPKLTDEYHKCVSIPISQAAKMPENLPTLVRLRSNNKVEVIVKVVRESGRSETTATYDIEWTPKGYTETVESKT